MTRLPPCIECGLPGSYVSCRRDNVEVVGGYLCDVCFSRALDEFENFQAQFNTLIEAGVDRGTANRIMIKRIESEHPERYPTRTPSIPEA